MHNKIKSAKEGFMRCMYEEDEDEDVEMEEIQAPVVWGRTGTGFRVEDLKEDRFEEVIKMIKDHYIPNELLCKSTKLQDDGESLTCYLTRLIFHMYGMTSVIAIDENYEEDIEEEEQICNICSRPRSKSKIAGVLITRIVQKLDYGRIFSRVQIVQGSAMKKCVGLRAHMSKRVDLFARFHCDSFLRFYDLCILPEYRGEGLGIFMLRCGFNIARSMKVPLVMGLFADTTMQKLAKQVGMQVLFEVEYSDWKDLGGDVIFNNTGNENYTCTLMAGLIPPLPKPKKVLIAKEDEQKKKGLGIFMLRCGFNIARSMKVPLVMGLFADTTMQKLAKQVGMQVLFEVEYSDWKDLGGDVIFNNTGNENYTCTLMAGLIPPLPKPKKVLIAKEDEQKKKGGGKQKAASKKKGK